MGLIQFADLHDRIGQNAQTTARKFTWDHVNDQMDAALTMNCLEPKVPDIGKAGFKWELNS